MSRIIFGLMWLAHFLPLRALAVLGEAVGMVSFWLIPERRRVTRINLEKCFPHIGERERERLARAHFRIFGRSFVERALLWWAPRKRIEKLIRIQGIEHLRVLRGQPVILFLPHFAGLDAGGTRITCEANIVSIYSQQKDPRFAALLRHGRSRFGDQRMLSRQAGVRAAIRAMREGRPLLYLPDQDYGPRDALFVPFFGVPAATVPGLARIARITGAKVLPCVTRILPGGSGYLVTIDAPWEHFPSGDLKADTRRMNEYIEIKVLEMPEQYLWMHKRFKTRPPGEARFY